MNELIITIYWWYNIAPMRITFWVVIVIVIVIVIVLVVCDKTDSMVNCW
jgi:hypothetical protein